MVTFTKDETLPARDLRTLSQKNLLDLISKNEKLGLIMNDELVAAMVKIEKLEQLVQRIQDLETQLAHYEDKELSMLYGERTTLPESEWEQIPEGTTISEWYKKEQS